MGVGCSKSTKLNSDITSKKIKKIKVLGILDLKPKKRSIYFIEIEFENNEILNLRVREEYYRQYLTLV